MKKFWVAITILAVAITTTIIFSSCKQVEKLTKKKAKKAVEDRKGETSHFGFMPASFDYKAGEESGGRWDRPFFERFQWGEIEKEKGKFDFRETDKYVKEAQKYGFHTLANIQSYNPWDQGEAPQEPMGEEPAQKPEVLPKDMNAYKNFVKKLVERYDGDGKDDMNGLKYPIRYWEIANEPEMQEPPLAFFEGTPQDYVNISKATYEAVKEADEKAKVVQGGMAGMEEFMTSFWQQVFDAGGANYFDIANIHSIGHGESLNIPEFKEFLAKNNIDKPIWVTEVQIEDRQKKKTEEEYAKSLARSYLYALANGVEKLFYVNLRLPKEGLPPEEEGGPGFSDLSTLVSTSGDKQPLFYAHKTIANKLDGFSSAEIIKDAVSTEPEKGNRTILEGQYKFKVGNKTIYVIWGKGDIPRLPTTERNNGGQATELSGKVKVTNLTGEEITMDASQITLSDSPIFVEMAQ